MTIKKNILFVILSLCTALMQAQSAVEVKLRNELMSTTTDTARARINGALAWELKFTQNAEAWRLASEELKLANGDPMLSADAYRTMGLVRVIENRLPEGLELYRLAIANAKKAKSEFYEASCLSLIAGMYQDMGDYDRSLQYYFDGLKVAERGCNDRMIGTLSNNIATIYGTTGGESALVLRYYKRAMAAAEKQKNFASAELIASNMAEEYMRAGKIDSAEQMIRTTIAIDNQNGVRNYEHAVALTGISDVYIQMNRPGEAEGYLRDAIAVMDSLRRPINVLSPVSVLCKLYIKQNQIAKAEPLALRLVNDGQRYHAKAFISEGYRALSDIAHMRRQDVSALEYYRQYNAWDDSVFSDTKQQSLANVQSRAALAQKELEVQYRTNEKTQENKILKLQNGNLINTLIGAGIVALMLILLAFLVMRMNRIKEEDNKLLKQQKQQIELQSQEKDTLMLEIHHRVKNNLQIVSSLLNLQANSMTDENAIMALRESQNRVKSIALIHQKLYAQEALSAILLEEYINQLSADLKSVFNAQLVTIRCAVYPPHLRLNMDTSIPLGVILNELITNSIKYAQVNKPGGLISIDLKDNLDGTCTLQYADNGIGMPDSFDFKRAVTLGMRIVNELTRQIRGTLSYSGEGGSRFTLLLPLAAQKK